MTNPDKKVQDVLDMFDDACYIWWRTDDNGKYFHYVGSSYTFTPVKNANAYQRAENLSTKIFYGDMIHITLPMLQEKIDDSKTTKNPTSD